MSMFTIDYLSKENGQVFFSSEYSHFRADCRIEEYKDVSMNGEIETPIIDYCVRVRNQAAVFVLIDSEDESNDVVLDCRLSDEMCRELERLIEKEL